MGDARQIGEGGVGGQDDAVLFDHHAIDAALDQVIQARLGLQTGLDVQGVAGDAGAQHHQSDGGDGEGQDQIGRSDSAHIDQRADGHDRHGGHAGEVQGHDAQDHQHDRDDLAGLPGAIKRQGAQDDRPRHGGGDIGGRPVDDGVGRKGRHAGIVHRHHGQTEQYAANLGRGRHPARGHPERQRAAGDGDAQGQAGQHRAVADGDAGLIGDHRHEMGAPDRRPGRHRAHEGPGQTRALFGGAQAAIQAEGDDRTDQAQAGGQRDEPEIMVVGQAGEKAHEATDLGGTVCRRSGRCLIRRARTGLTKRYGRLQERGI